MLAVRIAGNAFTEVARSCLSNSALTLCVEGNVGFLSADNLFASTQRHSWRVQKIVTQKKARNTIAVWCGESYLF